MDIQRTVLWVVFSMSLLLLWDNWMRYTGQPSMFFPTKTQEAKPAANANGTPVNRADVPQAAAPANPAPTAAAVPAGTTPTQSQTVTITTDVIKAEIDTTGGELKRLELLKHRATDNPSENVVLFEASANQTYLGQTGLIGGPFPNHKSTFVAKPGPRTLDGAKQIQLVMESEQNGVKLTKTYTFERGSYIIDIKHDVTNTTGAPITPSLYTQLVRDGNKLPGESMFYSTFTGPAVFTEEGKFQKVDFETIEKGKIDHVTKADSGWIAMVQHYFVSAFLPPRNTPREIFTKKIDTNLYAVGTIVPMGTVAPGATASMTAKLFSGPQESAQMEKFTESFDLVKDYGWLTIVAKPVFWLMDQIHKVIGNWGWTIIVLTILIKLAFFPLSAASYRSMAKMKQVTPKMTAIRERHKGDPQKMNQAMMELYKTEKINPLGGCLPILVQIPVFIALYWVLLASVEMRNAPWLGWIQDLSAPDPWYILPVVMAISMFIQTKLNPTPPDPIQAKIMMFMPIAFSVMFFFFPSGLVLYWVVNNILSIGQQWVITKRIEAGKPA
jgi:YidC/Oxa1 family membrane protein insertase